MSVNAAQVDAHEKVLGYINHEIRNPLNVLVASIDFVDEMVQKWFVERSRGRPKPTSENELSFGSPAHSESDSISSTPSETSSDEQVVEDLKLMRHAALQLERQVNDMVDFHRLKQGRLKIEYEVVHLASLLRHLVADHSLLTDVPIVVEDTPRGLQSSLQNRVFVDEVRLRQLLVNGLTNAIKYTEKGVIRIIASMDEAPEDTSRVNKNIVEAARKYEPNPSVSVLRIDIVDTGRGLLGVDPERLFTPFNTYGPRHKRVPLPASSLQNSSSAPSPPHAPASLPSSGLGLPISRLLANALQGEVHLTDTGHGCMFSIRLPVARITGVMRKGAFSQPERRRGKGADFSSPEAPVLLESSKSPKINSNPVAHQPAAPAMSAEETKTPERKILVVDDMPNNVRLASRLLQRLGCEVVTVTGADIPRGVRNALEEAGNIAAMRTESDVCIDIGDPTPNLTELNAAGAQPAVVSSRPFDLVLLDIRLGDIDGVQLFSAFKEELVRPLPFVALTASATREDVALYRKVGFHGCVPKPFSMKRFASLLDKFSAGESSWPEL